MTRPSRPLTERQRQENLIWKHLDPASKKKVGVHRIYRQVLIARNNQCGIGFVWVRLMELAGEEFRIAYESARQKEASASHNWRIHRTRSNKG